MGTWEIFACRVICNWVYINCIVDALLGSRGWKRNLFSMIIRDSQIFFDQWFIYRISSWFILKNFKIHDSFIFCPWFTIHSLRDDVIHDSFTFFSRDSWFKIPLPPPIGSTVNNVKPKCHWAKLGTKANNCRSFDTEMPLSQIGNQSQ